MNHLLVNIDHKAFGNNSTILHNVGIELTRGSLAALFGPSGCGKSTCLRIISGLDTNFCGSVFLEGTPITGPTRHIGIVFQEQVPFQWLTVSENIQFGIQFLGSRNKVGSSSGLRHEDLGAESLAELVGLKASDLAKYPRELSGGMKQRMSFARALAVNPDVLLLDEPFSSLDFESRQDLQDVVLRINRKLNTTIILVSHDPGEVLYLAESIYLLAGSPATVLERMTPKLPSRGEEELRYTTEFQQARRHLTDWLRDHQKNA